MECCQNSWFDELTPDSPTPSPAIPPEKPPLTQAEPSIVVHTEITEPPIVVHAASELPLPTLPDPPVAEPIAPRQQQLAYVAALARGEIPAVRPRFDHDYEEKCIDLQLSLMEMMKPGHALSQAHFDDRVREDARLASLLDAVISPALRVPVAPVVEVVRPEINVPPLPQGLSFDAELVQSGCRWLNDYEEYSAYWSPRGFARAHTAVGTWLLSTVAARRVHLPLGANGEYTPFFIAIVAPSGSFAKSTTAKNGIKLLQACGLEWLLCPETITPQMLLSEMSGAIPKDYENLSEDAQLSIRKRLAFSGQVGWFYEEYGQQLDAMTQPGGPMSDFRGVMRRLDDCYEKGSQATLSRGREEIRNPYLALLGVMTPDDLQQHAGKRSKFWRDGFFARFAFVTPPLDTQPGKGYLPLAEYQAPPHLTIPLLSWHRRLGERVATISERYGGKGAAFSGLQLECPPLVPHTCTISSQARHAYNSYCDTLGDMQGLLPEQLKSNYARIAKQALRMAMLFASLENEGLIELRHWARAQSIAEEWRISLHELYEIVTQQSPSREVEREQEVLRIMKMLTEKNKMPPTTRDISHATKQCSLKMIKDIVQSFVLADIVAEIPIGKTRRYRVIEN